MIKKKQYSLEYKQQIVRDLSLGQISIAEMSKREGISVGILDKWKRQYGSNESGVDVSEKKELMDLRKKVAMYEKAFGEIKDRDSFSKKKQDIPMSTKEKKEFIKTYLCEHLGIKKSCEIMKISPNTMYYKKVDKKEKDAPILKRILEVKELLPTAGLPTMTKILKKEMTINRKKVHRIMKENGLLNRPKK